MITAIVQFKLPRSLTREEARQPDATFIPIDSVNAEYVLCRVVNADSGSVYLDLHFDSSAPRPKLLLASPPAVPLPPAEGGAISFVESYVGVLFHLWFEGVR